MLKGDNKKKKAEYRFFNPLSMEIGNHVDLDVEGKRGIAFQLERICVYQTHILDETFEQTDYWLKGVSPTSSEYVRCVLRLEEDRDSFSETGCRVYVYDLFEEFPWDEDFEQILYDESNIFVVEEEESRQDFYRIANVFDAYQATVVDLFDKDQDGNVDDSEITCKAVEYWDYSTQGELGDEFLWVVKDSDTGYFTLLKGVETSAQNVMVI